MGDRDSDYGDSHYDPLGADFLRLEDVDLTPDEVTQEPVAQALAQDLSSQGTAFLRSGLKPQTTLVSSQQLPKDRLLVLLARLLRIHRLYTKQAQGYKANR